VGLTELDDSRHLFGAVWEDDCTRRGFLQRVSIGCIRVALCIACAQAIIGDDEAELLEKTRI
jgi:hypothetical protein